MRKALSYLVLMLSVALCLPPADAAIESAEHLRHLEAGRTCIRNHDYKGAYEHFHTLARNGCPMSQCILGIMHQNGAGASKDGKQAEYWLKKSATQEFPDAQLRLGELYMNGSMVTRDTKQATYWLEKAAAHGVAQAQFDLGKFYTRQAGPNMERGRAMLQQAVRGGIKEAQGLLDQLPAAQSVTSSAPNPLSSGLQNLEQSWQGYTDVTKQLTALNGLNAR